MSLLFPALEHHIFCTGALQGQGDDSFSSYDQRQESTLLCPVSLLNVFILGCKLVYLPIAWTLGRAVAQTV